MDIGKVNWLKLLSEVKGHWNKLLSGYADQQQVNVLFEEIRYKYSRRSRHYHNFNHILALLRLSEQYSHLLTDKVIVDWAIFYHDIVYNVLRKDNEHRSALLAIKRLPAIGVPQEAISQIALFIEATKTHQVPAGAINTNDLQLFLDFDMSILAAPWNEYELYMQQVRREYRLYPDKLYIPGRKQFLEHCLQSPVIFHSSLFKEQFEATARKNIQREVELLTS